jgi:hypothetical protein
LHASGGVSLRRDSLSGREWPNRELDAQENTTPNLKGKLRARMVFVNVHARRLGKSC